MDFFVEELRNADIKILGLLTGLVPGNFINCMIPSLRFKSPIDTLDDYKAFCEKNAERYKNTLLLGKFGTNQTLFVLDKKSRTN